MELSSFITIPGSRHRTKRLGRGDASGKGGSAGKGTKGQMSRKGHKHKQSFEGGQMPLLRRLPKRGFKNPTDKTYTVVTLSALNQFEDGAVVDPCALLAMRLVKQPEVSGIKILANGKLERKLTVKANAFSAAAKAAIEAAGGTVEIVK